ncbi:hypothetical protein [Chryseobacterium aquaticum]|uniref:hypothetical protein n=1 Tax=Chryseobacterium aquaticum TaxID=452084 RepID=UPI002FC9249E
MSLYITFRSVAKPLFMGFHRFFDTIHSANKLHTFSKYTSNIQQKRLIITPNIQHKKITFTGSCKPFVFIALEGF